MIDQKPDSEQIERFLGSLTATLQLEPSRAWWPNYLFHTTEIHNAVDILESGQLLSRQDVGQDMSWENANREIIDQTPADVQQMARFYFRPRTPMTFNNEGFRTPDKRHKHAYCPFPVMLVFRSLPILIATGTLFSDGNCSSRDTRRGESAEFLQSLPFDDIYHDSAWPRGEEGERIKRHRQAEVLVSSPFAFQFNRPQVRLRSIAERETLLSQLTPQTADRYRSMIQVSSKQKLFHKRWTYVETVAALGNQITIRFNESTADRSEFSIRLSFLGRDGERLAVREVRRATVDPLKVKLGDSILTRELYRLRIDLEGTLAYENKFDSRSQQIFERRR